MKKHLFLTLALAAAALFSLPRTAAAIPLLSVVPSFQSGNIGDLFSVDLVISNLGGEEVGSFDIDLTYNSTILSGQSITLGNGLGDPGNPLETFPVAASFAGGVADISEISVPRREHAAGAAGQLLHAGDTELPGERQRAQSAHDHAVGLRQRRFEYAAAHGESRDRRHPGRRPGAGPGADHPAPGRHRHGPGRAPPPSQRPKLA